MVNNELPYVFQQTFYQPVETNIQYHSIMSRKKSYLLLSFHAMQIFLNVNKNKQKILDNMFTEGIKVSINHVVLLVKLSLLPHVMCHHLLPGVTCLQLQQCWYHLSAAGSSSSIARPRWIILQILLVCVPGIFQTEVGRQECSFIQQDGLSLQRHVIFVSHCLLP